MPRQQAITPKRHQQKHAISAGGLRLRVVSLIRHSEKRISIRECNVRYSADPDTEQLARGRASAGCQPGATGKTRVRSLELAGMVVMVAVQGSGIGR